MISKDKIEEYILFFQDKNQSAYEIINGYIKYHDTVDLFINDCYECDMMDTQYLETLGKGIKNGVELKKLIETADIDKLKAILTFYIRGERFSEGMIAKAIDEEILVSILKRIY